jgi:hypothetical protein
MGLLITWAAIETFSITGHGSEDNQLAERLFTLNKRFQQRSRAADIRINIVLNTIEQLPDANCCGTVETTVAPVSASSSVLLIRTSPTRRSDLIREVVRPPIGVNLLVEKVQHNNFVALPEELIGEERPNKTCAACNQNPFRHATYSPWERLSDSQLLMEQLHRGQSLAVARLTNHSLPAPLSRSLSAV